MIDCGVKSITVSLLLSVVVLCLAVLSVLTVSTAAADRRLAEKYAQSVQEEYALEAAAQEWLAAFDADLKAGLVTETKVEKTIGREDERHIAVLLEVDTANREYRIVQWKKAAPDIAETGMDNLFTGSGAQK